MTGSRLAALLDQATPGEWAATGKAVKEKQHRSQIATVSPFYGSEADARLIALAPDLARLLVDMAALVVDQGKFIDFDATPNLSERYGALLARFAALDEKAGGA